LAYDGLNLYANLQNEAALLYACIKILLKWLHWYSRLHTYVQAWRTPI